MESMTAALIVLCAGLALMAWPLIILGIAASDPAPSLWFRPMQMLVIFAMGFVVALAGGAGIVSELWT